MIDDGTIDDLRLEIQLTRCRHPLVETHGVRLRVPNGNMYRMQSYAGGEYMWFVRIRYTGWA